jgi:F-type H+-transporting ATPase subunit epsilon
MPLRCEIITQERKLFDDDVDIVIAPAIEGEMGILPRHSPLIAALGFGELRIRQEGIEQFFAIGGGVLQVAENRVIVLADSAERADEIDTSRAESARRRAESLMADAVPEDAAKWAALEAAMRRADLRLKVARRRTRRGTGPDAMEF